MIRQVHAEGPGGDGDAVRQAEAGAEAARLLLSRVDRKQKNCFFPSRHLPAHALHA
jgi:hypothetical protein